MLTPDHKGAQSALEQAIAAERAKLVSARAVQMCLYEVLLYAEGEDAVVYAEAARVAATLMEAVLDKAGFRPSSSSDEGCGAWRRTRSQGGKMTRKHSRGSRPIPVREDSIGAGEFNEVLGLIEVARRRAHQAVNAELVGLYWQLGEYISRKIESAQWGDSVVDELAVAIARRYPSLRGYTRRNLFRMRQFYETYRRNEKVSPLVRQSPWTHHLIILSQAKPPETREFYMLAAIRKRWTSRELEALDCDVRKPNERASIGVLLCATKDDELVEYALARTASPTLVAEYQTVLPSRELLRRKLHELYAQLAPPYSSKSV